MVGIVTYNLWYLLACFVLCVLGLGLVTVALFVGPASSASRDRAIVGLCLLGTAFVFFFLSQGGDALFSDAASSVSNAPG